tara:strand:+ start:1244 stop:1531 length:288 start_codon:yes stop_codon:yes gene_type:complete
MGNMKKMMYQSKGVKPTQEEFDTFSQRRKERLSKKYPGVYKISADTPTKAELDAIVAATKKKSKKTGGTMYKEGGVKKSTASEFLSPPSVSNIDN